MKTLATHPDLVRAWLLAQAGMPLPSAPTHQEKAPMQAPPPPPPYRH